MRSYLKKLIEKAGYEIHKIPSEEIRLSRKKVSDDANYYASYIPDKYSRNISTYHRDFFNFFNADDVKKWNHENYDNNSGDLSRFYFLNMVVDQLIYEKLDGDIAELGVFKGNSAYLLAKFARAEHKTAYLFDTFEGFDLNDLVGRDETIYDENEFKNTSISQVQQLVGTDNTIYVKGYFPDSLSQIGDEIKYCLVHIDCDLEQPFRHALNYFYPRLVPGGFLIMHDYSSLYWEGAKNAMDEFFSNKAEKLIPIPDKSGTVVVRKYD